MCFQLYIARFSHSEGKCGLECLCDQALTCYQSLRLWICIFSKKYSNHSQTTKKQGITNNKHKPVSMATWKMVANPFKKMKFCEKAKFYQAYFCFHATLHILMMILRQKNFFKKFQKIFGSRSS